MNNQQHNLNLPEEEGIDIKKYLFLIIGHWWWFAITILLSLSISYLINRYSQEVHSASCSLIIGEPDRGVGSIDNILDELARARGKKRKAVVENEITILKSYKMARLALEELDFGITYTKVGRRNIAEAQIYKTCPFYVRLDTSFSILLNNQVHITILSNHEYRVDYNDISINKIKFGEICTVGELRFRIYLRNPNSFKYSGGLHANKYYFSINNINNQAKAYSKALSVEVNAEKGSILSLRMTGFVPGQIADYLNKLCEVYIRNNLEEKNITSENTIRFIDLQLQGIVDSLETTGLRLQKFRSTNNVINLSKEGAFLFEKMQSLQTTKASLDINARYFNYLLEYIDKRKDFSDVIAPSVIGIQDHLLNSLVAKLNELNLQRRNLNLSVAENSPQLAIINNQIINTRNALQENLISLIEGNQISKTELDNQIVEIEIEVKKLPGTERQLIDIEREFAINDQIYTFLLEKRAEAGISRASNISDHKILDIARPQNSIRIQPRSSTNLLIALITGCGLPFLLLILKDFFNTKIVDRKYLETNLNIPIIGNIGHNDDGTDIPVNENPRSSLAESFRALRTNLQFILKEPNTKVIAVSSAISGEGKTFNSINLASILAMAGKKTLIVSLDLRKPKVHKVFNLNNEVGMSTYLIEQNNLNEILRNTNIRNLTVTTSGPIPPNPSELLSSKRMREFISESKKLFDYIILDTPPVGIVTDTLTLLDTIDAFIFVIRHNYSDKQVVDLANHIHNKHLRTNMGIIVNDIQLTGYYGYTYRYSYDYGYVGSYNKQYYELDSENNFIDRILKKKRNIWKS